MSDNEDKEKGGGKSKDKNNEKDNEENNRIRVVAAIGTVYEVLKATLNLFFF